MNRNDLPVPGVPGPIAWYAVYTKHQHEKTAADFLRNSGFEIVLPLYRTVRRWKDRNKTISLPLFPCYLFVRTHLERKLQVLIAPGVFWLVENGGRPIAVPESDVDAIRRIVDSPARVEPHPLVKQGEPVRIRMGPLAGIEGILTQVKNQHRVVVSVNVVQRAVAVEVDLSMIERLHRPRALALSMAESRLSA